MSQYKIEKRIKYDTDGSIISTLWDVYHENGQLTEGGLLSEEMAQQAVNIIKERERFREIELPPSNKNEQNLK
ncbi:TPA: hypothetical protein OT136_003622 [Enterobacter hormaechei]|nr:hypothetical protein [Enterobacter hormaechei]